MYKHFSVQSNGEMLRFEQALVVCVFVSFVHFSNSIGTDMFKEWGLHLVTSVKLTGSAGSAT